MDKHFTIMLVDDDQDDQMIFVSALNDIDNNIECSCYDNAEQSLEVLQKNSNKPDYIFLDLNLPYMHGFEFLDLLKSSRELNNIPVIVYSTSSRESDKVKAKELGAVNFLSKPSTMDELRHQISHLLTSQTVTE